MVPETFFQAYAPIAGVWDEMLEGDAVRPPFRKIIQILGQLDTAALQQKDKLAGELFMNQGITFTVYSDNEGIERIFPFDIIPRIITSLEWKKIEEGIKQRLKALNLFLKDIYSEQQIVKDGIIPASLIASCPHFLKEV